MGEPYGEEAAGVPVNLLLTLPCQRGLALKWVVVEGIPLKATGAPLQLRSWIRRNRKSQVIRVGGCWREGRKAALITTRFDNRELVGLFRPRIPLIE